MTTEKERIKTFTSMFKAAKWKSTSNFLFHELNKETLAYFTFFTKGDMFRMQYGVSNRRLNRASWDLYGIAEEFGSNKDQMTNSSRCMLSVALGAKEFRQTEDEESVKSEVLSTCLQNGDRFSSVEKIDEEIKSLPADRQSQLNKDRICVAMALHRYTEARSIIEFEKNTNFAYELSIFSHADQFLKGLPA